MPVTLPGEDVAKKKTQDEREPLDQRMNLMVSVSWQKRADARASKLGLSLSAYIRMVVEQDLERHEAADAD